MSEDPSEIVAFVLFDLLLVALLLAPLTAMVVLAFRQLA